MNASLDPCAPTIASPPTLLVFSRSARSSSPLGFTGQLTNGTWLQDLRARMFDPQTGQFLSRDSYAGATDTQSSLNRYTYELDTPTLNTAPSGHCSGLSGCWNGFTSGFSSFFSNLYGALDVETSGAHRIVVGIWLIGEEQRRAAQRVTRDEATHRRIVGADTHPV